MEAPGHAHLPDGPLVVGPVNTPADMGCPAMAACDVVEWRLDGLQAVPVDAVREAMAAAGRPALLTARREDEGGLASWPGDDRRLASVSALAGTASLVDVEARSLADGGGWGEAASAWKAQGCGLVVSLHDFQGVPETSVLRDAAQAAADHGAAVLKVAATAATLDEVARLGRVFELAAGLAPAVAVMAMGPFGLSSRLLFAQAGSRLNYGYLREASVPGQWPVAELRRWIGAGQVGKR